MIPLLQLIQLIPPYPLTCYPPYTLPPSHLMMTTRLTRLLPLTTSLLSSPSSMTHIPTYPVRIALCIPILHYALPPNILTLCTLQLMMTFLYYAFRFTFTFNYFYFTTFFLIQFFFTFTTRDYSLKILPFKRWSQTPVFYCGVLYLYYTDLDMATVEIVLSGKGYCGIWFNWKGDTVEIYYTFLLLLCFALFYL